MCPRGTGNTIFPKTHNTLVYYCIPPAAAAYVAASATVGAAAAARRRLCCHCLRRRRLRCRYNCGFCCYCCCFLVDCCLPPAAASVSVCPRRSCLTPPLPLLLSAGAIAIACRRHQHRRPCSFRRHCCHRCLFFCRRHHCLCFNISDCLYVSYCKRQLVSRINTEIPTVTVVT